MLRSGGPRDRAHARCRDDLRIHARLLARALVVRGPRRPDLAGEAFRHRDVLVLARREWPLVEAAVVPTLLLALAWAGVWSRETGAGLALAAAVLQIMGWALVAGRRAGWSWLRAGFFAAVDGALGIVLLLLERSVH
jgi:hypothetical protein